METRAFRASILATTLCAITAVLAQGQLPSQETDDATLDRVVAPFFSNHEPAFDAILRFGRQNHIPLGIVVDDEICSTVLTEFRTERVPARMALAEFVKKLPSYRWDSEYGVVVFGPEAIPEATAQFLALEPPAYSVPEETLQGQAIYTWMNIRAILRPHEGTAFNILSSRQSEKWPTLALDHTTIRRTLDRLVGRKQGGAWILSAFKDLSKVADRRPFSVADYSDPAFDRLTSPCTKAEDR